MNLPTPTALTGRELRSRSLDRATTAFQTRDVKLSREAHTPPSPSKRKLVDEPHGSNILKKHKTKVILKGVGSALTGIATSSFTLVGMTSAFGLHIFLQHSFAMVASIAVIMMVIASGVYLALSDATTTSSTIAFYNSEKRRETWEYDNYMEGEEREMVELYTNKGMDVEDAENVVHVLSKYKDLFVDIMMAEELQLSPVDDLLPPFETGLIMLVSHIFFGLFPLTPLLLSEAYSLHLPHNTLLIMFFSLVAVLLCLLGIVKSYYINTWHHAITNLITTVLSIFVAAMLGSYLSKNWLYL